MYKEENRKVKIDQPSLFNIDDINIFIIIIINQNNTHLRLGWPSWLRPDMSHLRWTEEALRLWKSWHEVATGAARLEDLSHLLHAHAGQPLGVLRVEVSLAIFFALSQGHVQRFRSDDTAIHLGDGFGRLLRRRETYKAETLAAPFFQHDLQRNQIIIARAVISYQSAYVKIFLQSYLRACDGSKWSEFVSEALIVDGVVQVLDVQIDSLVAVEAVHLQLFKLPLQLLLSLSFLLGAADIQGLQRKRPQAESQAFGKSNAIQKLGAQIGQPGPFRMSYLAFDDFLPVEFGNSFLGRFGVDECDKAKSSGLAILVGHLVQGELV